MKTKWKTIKNFKNVEDNLYQISSNGDVRYRDNHEIIRKKIANKKKHPYYAVYLKQRNGKKEWVLVHQLVATFFVKIPDRYKYIEDIVPDHLDNDGLNNNYRNLEWKTRGENVKSAFEKGFLNNSCDNNKNAIVSDYEVHEICMYLEQTKEYDDILYLMDFPNNKQYRSLLKRIKNKVAWVDISSQYNIPDTVKYSDKQKETITKLPIIRKMISDGFKDYEIVRSIWGDLDKKQLKAKGQTVSDIRNHKIYENIP